MPKTKKGKKKKKKKYVSVGTSLEHRHAGALAVHFDSFSSLLSPRETVADCTLQLMRGNHNQRVQDRKFEIPTSMETSGKLTPKNLLLCSSHAWAPRVESLFVSCGTSRLMAANAPEPSNIKKKENKK